MKDKGCKSVFCASSSLARWFVLFGLLITSPVQSQQEEGSPAEGGQKQLPADGQPVPEGSPAAGDIQDGPAFRIDRFILGYAQDHPDHPPVDELLSQQVRLGQTEDGFVAARPGVAAVTMTLGSIEQLQQPVFYASAIRKISESLVGALNARGLIGVYVEPDTRDIDRTSSRDMRSEGQFALRLLIRTAFVSEARTIGSGERVPVASRINHPRHERILRLSPLHAGDPGRPGHLLHKDLLDEFLLRLNRHPGRRVDASVAAGPDEDRGGITLDYLVSENKPWLAYAQLSNTGTDQTDEYRVRMGFVHHQLTDNDDILRVDYVTAGFDEAHAVTASYDAPLGQGDRVRWRAYGAWSDFTASEIALAEQGLRGESWLAGGELAFNIFQDGPVFVDVVGGGRFEHIFVDNRLVSVDGEDDFLLPYIGLRLDRTTDTATLAGSLMLETNFPSLAGTSENEISRLGREAVERDFFMMKWNLFGSFYLEPFLNTQAWRGADVPVHPVLVHELAFTLRGQVAFDDRVVPQFELSAGGLYSVRGYAEAITSGDNVVIGGIEYRFHLPRALPIEPDPSKTPLLGQPFRFSPQRQFGRTDWDLVLKAFLDMAHTHHNDSGRSDGVEEDETLLGAGIGLELLLKRNVSFRADWAVALRDAVDVTNGSSQFHFVTMILY